MKTLIIYTGGTIGMVKKERSNVLVPSDISIVQKFLNQQNLEEGLSFYSTKEIIDSSNFKRENAEELLKIVKENYTEYDNFLILIGTDTMAYISALVAYCIEGLTKPIVFTGAMYPIDEEESDGKTNLKYAVLGLKNKQFPSEVGVYFNKNWYRAVSVVKSHSSSVNAYECPKELNKYSKIESSLKFKVVNKIKGNIHVYKFIPYQDLTILKLILKQSQINGLVLEAFGEGNFPEFDEETILLFKERIKKGLQVILLTQCYKGEVKLAKYASGLSALDLNFINGKNLTVESAIAKLTYILSITTENEEIKGFFEESIRGE